MAANTTGAFPRRGAAGGARNRGSVFGYGGWVFIGGAITEHVNWSWVFYINVPIGILGLFAARIFIDESKDTREQRLDLHFSFVRLKRANAVNEEAARLYKTQRMVEERRLNRF